MTINEEIQMARIQYRKEMKEADEEKINEFKKAYENYNGKSFDEGLKEMIINELRLVEPTENGCLKEFKLYYPVSVRKHWFSKNIKDSYTTHNYTVLQTCIKEYIKQFCSDLGIYTKEEYIISHSRNGNRLLDDYYSATYLKISETEFKEEEELEMPVDEEI